AGVPVVLASSSYDEPADRDLASLVGADAFVVRTGERDGIAAALLANLGRTEAPEVAPRDEIERLHAQRLQRQLDRQQAKNAALTARAEAMSAKMAALSGMSRALVADRDLDDIIRDLFANCLDVFG